MDTPRRRAPHFRKNILRTFPREDRPNVESKALVRNRSECPERVDRARLRESRAQQTPRLGFDAPRMRRGRAPLASLRAQAGSLSTDRAAGHEPRSKSERATRRAMTAEKSRSCMSSPSRVVSWSAMRFCVAW